MTFALKYDKIHFTVLHRSVFLARNVFVRAGVVLGRKSGLVKELYPPFFLGLGGVIGSGAQFMPWIHVKDLAGIILHSIENTKVSQCLAQ